MINENAVSILLVDDQPDNLLALEGLLGHENRNLVKALSGNEALSLLLEYDFALVLLDVQMPDMDGFETAEFMRQNERTKHIPIIFVTALNMEQKYVFKGYELGAVDYLFKPIEAEIITSKVQVFCDLYEKKQIIQNQLNKIIEQKKVLEKQMAEIKELKGILPICSYCKKIRDDHSDWKPLEQYITNRSKAKFSHSICPECAETHFPEYYVISPEEPRSAES